MANMNKAHNDRVITGEHWLDPDGPAGPNADEDETRDDHTPPGSPHDPDNLEDVQGGLDPVEVDIGTDPPRPATPAAPSIPEQVADAIMVSLQRPPAGPLAHVGESVLAETRARVLDVLTSRVGVLLDQLAVATVQEQRRRALIDAARQATPAPVAPTEAPRAPKDPAPALDQGPGILARLFGWIRGTQRG